MTPLVVVIVSVSWEFREVVSRCLPLGVFNETPSPSVDVLHRPSFRLLVFGTRIYRRGLGRPPRTLLSTGVPREGGVVGFWVVEAFRDAYHPIPPTPFPPVVCLRMSNSVHTFNLNFCHKCLK